MTQVEGTPVWFELTTPDPQGAANFLAAVAGWQVAPSPVTEHGGYLLAGPDLANGVAGLMAPPPGAPPAHRWTLNRATADVDRAVERVVSLGGSCRFGPMDIPHVGRFALVADPQGIAFTLLSGPGAANSRAFAQARGDTIGRGVWIELATPDPDGAFAFYGALFGWEKAGAMPMGEMGDYAFIGGAGDVRPGAVMSSTATGAPPRWNWYVHVADIDAAVATATARGGTLIQGPDPIPGGDYSANILDPHGIQLGLVGARRSGVAA